MYTESNILIVEDNIASLQLLVEILQTAGFKTIALNNANNALQSIIDNNPIIILLDIKMEGIDGFELCEIIKANNLTRLIPVIFISALDDYETKIKCFKTGAVDYITKPYNYLEVLARVKTHIELRQMQIELERQNVMLKNEIAERQKAEYEAQLSNAKAYESEKLKTAFLHNISHEIRTPLNAIVGFSEFLCDPDTNIDKRVQFAKLIEQNSNKLLAIIADIMDISEIEAGKEVYRESVINLNVLCKLIFEQLYEKAKIKLLQFTYNCLLTDNEANVFTDGAKLTEILYNIVSNAIKFTEKGKVEFGYKISGLYVEFYVTDTGIGIEHDMFAAIFKQFGQVETTPNRLYSGSGLGLSISKAYIEMLGGNIWLQSEIGVGTTFYFTVLNKHGK